MIAADVGGVIDGSVRFVNGTTEFCHVDIDSLRVMRTFVAFFAKRCFSFCVFLWRMASSMAFGYSRLLLWIALAVVSVGGGCRHSSAS